MGLQPHLILRVIATYRILIFSVEIFPCKSISPTRFGCLPPPLDSHDDKNFLYWTKTTTAFVSKRPLDYLFSCKGPYRFNSFFK